MLNTFWTKIVLIILTTIGITSCVKEVNTIGDDLIGGQETVTIFTDTIQVSTFVKRVDSVKSSNQNFVMIGAINDPKFGKTTTKLYSQVLLEKNNIDFGAGVSLDSIVLLMPYASFYGDSTSEQNFKIYEVNEKIDTFKTYSNQSYSTSTLLGEHTFTPRLKITNDDGDQEFSTLRIPLNSDFGQRILDQSGQPALENDDNFKDFFNGLSIEPANNHSQGQGGLFVFEFEKLKVRLFYNTPSSSDSIDFVFTSSSEHLGNFTHENNYSGTEAGNAINKVNSENLYLQGLAGLQTVIDFPTLDSLQNSLGGKSVTINKAFLQIYRTTDTLEIFKPSTGFLLNEYRLPKDGSSTDSNYYPIIDDNVGGFYNQEDNLYTFNITRYLSRRMLDVQNKEKLYLRNNTYTSLQSTVLKGVSEINGDQKMTLNVIYTKNKN